MKAKQLIKQLKELTNDKDRKRKEHRKDLKHLLKRMKKKEKELRGQLEQESDEAKLKKLKTNIDVLHAQRKKGIGVLKALKKS